MLFAKSKIKSKSPVAPFKKGAKLPPLLNGWFMFQALGEYRSLPMAAGATAMVGRGPPYVLAVAGFCNDNSPSNIASAT